MPNDQVYTIVRVRKVANGFEMAPDDPGRGPACLSDEVFVAESFDSLTRLLKKKLGVETKGKKSR